jgi:hypothetical protein
MVLFLSLYVIGVLGSLLHIYLLPNEERTRARVIEILLLYQIVFSLGLTSFMAFFGFTFLPEYIAQITNWPACPFEQQLGNVNLAFGVLGLLSIAYRGYFWFATIIGFSVWILSDGIHHLYIAAMENNLSPGNIGVPLWTDILVPIILLILLILYCKNHN